MNISLLWCAVCMVCLRCGESASIRLRSQTLPPHPVRNLSSLTNRHANAPLLDTNRQNYIKKIENVDSPSRPFNSDTRVDSAVHASSPQRASASTVQTNRPATTGGGYPTLSNVNGYHLFFTPYVLCSSYDFGMTSGFPLASEDHKLEEGKQSMKPNIEGINDLGASQIEFTTIAVPTRGISKKVDHQVEVAGELQQLTTLISSYVNDEGINKSLPTSFQNISQTSFKNNLLPTSQVSLTMQASPTSQDIYQLAPMAIQNFSLTEPVLLETQQNLPPPTITVSNYPVPTKQMQQQQQTPPQLWPQYKLPQPQSTNWTIAHVTPKKLKDEGTSTSNTSQYNPLTVLLQAQTSTSQFLITTLPTVAGSPAPDNIMVPDNSRPEEHLNVLKSPGAIISQTENEKKDGQWKPCVTTANKKQKVTAVTYQQMEATTIAQQKAIGGPVPSTVTQPQTKVTESCGSNGAAIPIKVTPVTYQQMAATTIAQQKAIGGPVPSTVSQIQNKVTESCGSNGAATPIKATPVTYQQMAATTIAQQKAIGGPVPSTVTQPQNKVTESCGSNGVATLTKVTPVTYQQMAATTIAQQKAIAAPVPSTITQPQKKVTEPCGSNGATTLNKVTPVTYQQMAATTMAQQKAIAAPVPSIITQPQTKMTESMPTTCGSNGAEPLKKITVTQKYQLEKFHSLNIQETPAGALGSSTPTNLNIRPTIDEKAAASHIVAGATARQVVTPIAANAATTNRDMVQKLKPTRNQYCGCDDKTTCGFLVTLSENQREQNCYFPQVKQTNTTATATKGLV